MAEVEECQDSFTVKQEMKEVEGEEEEGQMESQIQRAMRSRIPHFEEQADSLTFEGVRRLLEEDLGLVTYALDVHKRFIKQCLLECLNGVDGENGSKSSAETVEKNVDPGKGEVAESLEKEQIKENEEKMEESPVMGLLTPHKKTKVQTKETQGVEKKEVSTESTIKEAIGKRAAYLKANSDTVTMAGFRRLLEEDLELDKDTLFPFKKFITEQVDKVLESPKVSEPTSIVKKKTSVKKSDSKASKQNDSEESCDSLNSESEDERNSKKKVAPKRKILKSEETRKRERPAKNAKESSKKRSKLAETSEKNSDSEAGANASEDDHSQSSAEKPAKKKEVSAPSYGKRVDHLKSIIKSCGMSVPPVIYKKLKQFSENKREGFLIEELEDILSREGLSADPSEKEIKEVKKRKDRAKELEGIDTSNIVSSTRRRSATRFVPPPPKPKVTVKSDDDNAEDTESSNDDSGVDEDDEEEGEGDDDSQSEEINEEEDEDSD